MGVDAGTIATLEEAIRKMELVIMTGQETIPVPPRHYLDLLRTYRLTLSSPNAITRQSATLTPADKFAIADNISNESRSKSDVVQDVFDELVERFDMRKRP